jgi:transposase
LWYKRLESGVFKLPRVEAGARSVELRASELAMILDGIDMSKLKRVPRYERGRGTNQGTKKIAV